MHQKREKNPLAPQQNDNSPRRDDELSHAGGKDHEVESQENEEGTDIEVEEENLPSPAAAVHEEIRQEGEKELERDSLALGWSALAAGLSMGASLMAKGIFHARLPEGAIGFFVENLGYTIGFVIVIIAEILNYGYIICTENRESISHPVSIFLRFAWDHLCSIGFKSGEYTGKYSN